MYLQEILEVSIGLVFLWLVISVATMSLQEWLSNLLNARGKEMEKTITQQNWYLESDAIPTLQTLRDHGYRLGMISNTSDDKNVQQMVDRWELRPFFETIVTSAGVGFRKPDERIFRPALNHFGVPPEQVAMVGDSLEADILGANLSGIYSIWITRRVSLPGEGVLTIQPQAVIPALDLIPGLLTDIENTVP